jgi:hypothetical protein
MQHAALVGKTKEIDIDSLTKTKAWETTPLLDIKCQNYSAT